MVGCEVGVWNGSMSIPLLRKFPSLHLVMIDRYKEYDQKEPGNSLRKKTHEDMITTMAEVVHSTMFASDRRVMMVGDSALCLNSLSHNFLDFGFLDGGHGYETVLNDAICCNLLIRSGGIMAGHDYDGRGDRSGLFGVKRAVDKFAKAHSYKVNIIPKHKIW